MTFNKTILRLLFVLLGMSLLWSCESNLKVVSKINFSEFVPSGEADTINLKYTDSGKIKSILIAPKMLDYATVDFPFTEFPVGVDLTIYDNKQKRTFVRSDYAVSFKGTNIIDLRGNVKITSEAGEKLETEQLYFDQKNEWFFTEKNFKFTDPKGSSTTGEGIDFNKDFTRVNFQKVKALINEPAKNNL